MAEPATAVELDLGEWLLVWRRREHLKNAQLAARLGLSEATLSRLLAGKYEPTVTQAEVIAQALSTTVAEVSAAYRRGLTNVGGHCDGNR